MPDPTSSQLTTYTSLRRAVAGIAAIIVGAASAFAGPWQVVPLFAWDTALLVWESSVWWRIGRLDPVATKRHAIDEEPRKPTIDALLLTACVISLAAVLLAVVKANNAHGAAKSVLVGAGIATIVISWAMVHTLFTLRYTALYYTDGGGVDFHLDDGKKDGEGEPTYLDFAYLSFTIGMTYQVSDTDLTTKAFRRMALRQALLSYLFGTVIIAATINLVAGLVK
ncbi:MAG: DUF1345 domain-containing protein [Acidimicrobiales bacterium]